MYGAIINDKHTFRDWGLYLQKKPEAPPPEPKTKLISVPGSSVVIDLTEKLTGRIEYKTRTVRLDLVSAMRRDQYIHRYEQIVNEIHGRRVTLYIDEEPDMYYVGRAKVGALAMDKSIASFTIEIEAEPYRRERYSTGRRL